MKKNYILIIIIITFIIGLAYYQNSQKNNSSQKSERSSEFNLNETALLKNNILLSPKEVFIRRTTEINKTKNFEEVIAIIYKYDAKSEIEEVENKYKNASSEKKKALFTLMQSLFPSVEDLKNIKEVINNDTATVTAETPNGIMTAKLIKENGYWKISDMSGI